MESVPESFLDDEVALKWADAPYEYASMETTLLNPTLKGSHPWIRKALGFFKQAMCRNFDRPQRVLMLNKAIQLAPEFREALFWRGILRYQNVRENLEDLQRALSLTRRDTPQYLVIVGQMSAMQRNPDAAVEELTQALSLARNDDDRGEIHYFRAFANWWTDNDDNAISDCLEATKFRYNTRSAYSHLADMCHFLRRPASDIEEYFKRSLLPTPNFTELIKYAAWLRKVDRMDDAYPVVNQAIQINPYSAEGWDERSNLIKDTREEDLRKTIELDVSGRLLQPRRMYAAILADGGDFKKAVEVLTEGIKVKPRFSWHCLRGQMLVEGEETREAGFHDLRVALRMNPIDADTQYWMAKALLEHRGDDPQAAAEAKLRIANVAFLRPTAGKTVFDIPIPEKPEFTFFPGEAQGLLEYLQQWGVYVYVGVIRKVLVLLCECNEPQIKFEVLRSYWKPLYMWKRNKSADIVATCERALNSLWKLQPSSDLVSSYRAVIDSLEANSSGMKFSIVAGAIRVPVHDVIVSTYFDLSANDSNEWILPSSFEGDEDAVEVLVSFLYRRLCKRPLKHSSAAKVVQLIRDDLELQEFLKAIEYPPLFNPSEGEEAQLVFDFRFIRRTFAELLGEQSPRSDVALIAGNSDQPIRCHKSILSSCKYFSAMFSTGLRESRSSKVKLDSVSAEALSTVLSFMYGRPIQLEPDNCIEVLALSDLYDLVDLKVLCELYLVHQLEEQLDDAESFHEALQQITEAATMYNAPRLAARLSELREKQAAPEETEQKEQQPADATEAMPVSN